MSGYDRALYQTYLHAVPMFARCTPEQLDRIADSGTALSTKQGGDIVREGEPGDDFFVITSGKARVIRKGKEVGELGVGDYFGEFAEDGRMKVITVWGASRHFPVPGV